MSKGHAASAYYATLALRDYFSLEILKTYCENGSKLGGHVTASADMGVELSTGSLGHAFPYGMGIALGNKFEKFNSRVFVLISDGECNEGTTWESALISSHNELGNLVVIIDRNRIQSLGFTEDTLVLEPLSKKWESFGWEVISIDGHDHPEIHNALKLSMKLERTRPLCIIANTVKGKGVDFMENSVDWHYKSPNDDQMNEAIHQIEALDA
jgi:transketolase